MPYATLKAHMQIKTDAQPQYSHFNDDLRSIMEEQTNFIAKSMTFCCDAEVLDKVEDPFFLFQITICWCLVVCVRCWLDVTSLLVKGAGEATCIQLYACAFTSPLH